MMPVDKEFAQQHHYIVGVIDTPPETSLVLKSDDVFGVFDRYGDVDVQARNQEGVYCRGTRFLSKCNLRLAGARPLLLSSTVRRDNVVLAVDLTNPDLFDEAGLILPRGSLHIFRLQFLWQETMYQRIHVKNFSSIPIHLHLTLDYAADYADIFEVRGSRRERIGRRHAPRMTGQGAVIEYEGLDNVLRRTAIRSITHPQALTPQGLNFNENLAEGAEVAIELSFAFETGGSTLRVKDYESRLMKATAAARKTDLLGCTIETSNEKFNEWIERSRADLSMLITEVPGGLYPYAGVPWFATPFGRDGIITALECLWMTPELARGVLTFLTRTQATETDPERDAEPGKILHESREGEMAALGEIPFGRYYGSVDSTPLYLLLAAAYFKRTGDGAFIKSIWEGISRALDWVNGDGDPDQDGFVEYHRRSESGLVQQGWKDSQDSIFHANGDLAEGPIALSEVQGYVYAAKMGLAEIAAAFGEQALARRLFEEARKLQDRFEKAFWVPELGTYALALDGKKQRCEVRSSNPGHDLYCGIAARERACIVADNLFTDQFFTGWGIRTVAEGEARYNPMSYHNGSIWPHDNALISAGFSRYGFTNLSARILAGLFNAAATLEWSRLPELFCGFRRREGKSPTWYPTACSPQAWAAASVFLLLQSSIGLSIDASARQIVLRHPVLPPFLERLHIRNLALNSARVDLDLFQSGDGVAATVTRRIGDLELLLVQ